MAQLTIDGITGSTDNASKPWSLNQLDANTYQFQIRSGDRYTSPGWNDPTSVERDEISFFNERYSAGTQINLSETITIQPGPTNTASFLVLTQLHATTDVSPTYCPFTIQLDQSDHLLVVLQNPSSGYIPVYRSPDPIVRGQPMNLSSQMVMGPNGGGHVSVWLNGTQIVNYNGAVGATNSEYYWKIGIYRGSAAETTTATFSNIDISTGAAPAPTTPTRPTTPTSPTTPTNLAPTVTQASASPGTGIADNGDTITMTLGFSEAVTVTGTPTLALNNGDTATYVGGSGTNSLTFRTTVAPTDKDTSAVAITGVNLPNGASIKDLSGLAANLSGAVKTFTGLQIDATPTSPTTPTSPATPTTPTTPTRPTTPASSVTTPVLNVADPTLSVRGRGGSVGLGVNVSTTDTNDRVTVRVSGLPSYETITSTVDGRTHGGNNITLTAAQVDGGLVLNSYARRSHESTLTLTASAKDPVTGAVTSAAPQTIDVATSRYAATRTTASQTTSVTSAPATGATTTSQVGRALSSLNQNQDQASKAVANAAPALMSQLRGVLGGGVATSAPQAITATGDARSTGTSTASLANQSFALLNQYLAGSTGRGDSGQIVASLSNGASASQASFLTRPQH